MAVGGAPAEPRRGAEHDDDGPLRGVRVRVDRLRLLPVEPGGHQPRAAAGPRAGARQRRRGHLPRAELAEHAGLELGGRWPGWRGQVDADQRLAGAVPPGQGRRPRGGRAHHQAAPPLQVRRRRGSADAQHGTPLGPARGRHQGLAHGVLRARRGSAALRRRRARYRGSPHGGGGLAGLPAARLQGTVLHRAEQGRHRRGEQPAGQQRRRGGHALGDQGGARGARLLPIQDLPHLRQAARPRGVRLRPAPAQHGRRRRIAAQAAAGVPARAWAAHAPPCAPAFLRSPGRHAGAPGHRAAALGEAAPADPGLLTGADRAGRRRRRVPVARRGRLEQQLHAGGGLVGKPCVLA
mmetsp:Transcript_81758/g.231450  ORF Transcript_81758/g.231450 Transcript_81758/m.231450 type:complete len:351 (+) Transcript_81758:281-1333(+)